MNKNNIIIEKSRWPLIETHCHLDYYDFENIKEIIKQSNAMGVEKLITIAVSPDNQKKVVEIANENDFVYCSQGIHPHEAKKWDKKCLDTIINNINEQKVVAIGEIGLDYHYDHSPHDIQRKVFEEQIDLAIQYDMPIIIHTREAEDDTKTILNNFLSSIKNNIEFHCYSSNMELAEFALDNKMFFGFNGITSFKSAENVRDILRIIPLDKILLETDAPYLAPIPFRGKENFPYYLPIIAKTIQAILNIPEQQLLQQIYINSMNFFNLH